VTRLVLLAWMFTAAATAAPADRGGVRGQGRGEATRTSGDALFNVMRMPVGGSANVEVHPPVRERVVEAVIRGVSADLNALLTGRSNPYIAAMDAVYVGGGTWILKALMVRDEWDLRVVIVDGHLVIDVLEGIGEIVSDDGTLPTVQALVEGTAPSGRADPDLPVLFFLNGDALSHAMKSKDFVPLLPVPAALPRPTWRAVDRARSSMMSAQSEVALAQARYELGWLYLELDHQREARYYFELLEESPGALRPMDVALARARSALACSRWDEARERLREAYRYGARESAVVEGFGVVALSTGIPGRALTAQVMARVTGRPAALLLAAELLQRDGFFAESRPLLEALSGRVNEGLTAKRVALRLGDARLVGGERDAAVRAYRNAPKALGESRIALVDLLEQGPSEWAAAVPRLSLLAKNKGEVGAEALYLLAQIDAILGTQIDSINDLAKLIREHREIALASDAPERLWAVYKERQLMLLDQEKWFDAAALHEGAWHPMMRRSVDDPKVLMMVADAYEKIGLPYRALHLTHLVFPMLLEFGTDDTDLVIDLARLYGKTGNRRDGLKTLDFLRTRRIPRERQAEVAMIAAAMREEDGDAQGAAQELRRAFSDRRYRRKATIWLARMDAEAGRCQNATTTLWEKLMTARGGRVTTESRPYLALARCLAAQGDGTRAAAAAKAAAERSESEEEMRYANYLEAVATQWTEGEVRSNLATGEDIWAALSRDYDGASAFAAELEKRRIPDPFGERTQPDL
jgi:predicted negative regulator of RcsB-dependent stress response